MSNRGSPLMDGAQDEGLAQEFSGLVVLVSVGDDRAAVSRLTLVFIIHAMSATLAPSPSPRQASSCPGRSALA